jgi:hypothetical protein
LSGEKNGEKTTSAKNTEWGKGLCSEDTLVERRLLACIDAVGCIVTRQGAR